MTSFTRSELIELLYITSQWEKYLVFMAMEHDRPLIGWHNNKVTLQATTAYFDGSITAAREYVDDLLRAIDKYSALGGLEELRDAMLAEDWLAALAIAHRYPARLLNEHKDAIRLAYGVMAHPSCFAAAELVDDTATVEAGKNALRLMYPKWATSPNKEASR